MSRGFLLACCFVGCTPQMPPEVPRATREVGGIAWSRPIAHGTCPDLLSARPGAELPMLLRSQYDNVRASALENVAACGDAASWILPVVIEVCAGAKDTIVRFACADAMQGMPDATEAKVLRGYLDDGLGWQAAELSAHVLGTIGDKEALLDLERVSQTHWAPPVRAAAAKAFLAISGNEPTTAAPRSPPPGARPLRVPSSMEIDLGKEHWSGVYESTIHRSKDGDALPDLAHAPLAMVVRSTKEVWVIEDEKVVALLHDEIGWFEAWSAHLPRLPSSYAVLKDGVAVELQTKDSDAWGGVWLKVTDEGVTPWL